MTLKMLSYNDKYLDELEDFFFMNKILYHKEELLKSGMYSIAVDLDNIAAVQWLDGCLQIICNEGVYTAVLGVSWKEVAIDDKDF